MKARLYTTFIGSILTYGIENCDLNLGQLDEIKKAEGKILKKLFYLPRSSKSNELHSALRIELTNAAIIKQKLQFLSRLRKNSYTNGLLIEISKLSYKGNYLNELKQRIQLNQTSSLDVLSEAAKNKINEFETTEILRWNSVPVKAVQKAFEIHCPKARTLKVRELLKSYE